MSRLVSVIIPTFNRGHLIERTIKSVLEQTYSNIEIIIVSDGSTDNTKEVVKSFFDSRINFVEQANSGGCASPRNHGMRLAKGYYIAFCDDDDVWLPSKIEEQVKCLENNPSYFGCYTNMIRFDKSNEWLQPHENGFSTFESLLYVNVIPISSLMIRQDVIGITGFFNESKKVGSAEDYEYLLRITSQGHLFHLDKVLVKYWSDQGRMTTDSLSFSKAIKYLLYNIYCYYSVYRKNNNLSIFKFIKPFFYQLYLFAKRFGYIIKVHIFE